jgi:hypothetical protein
VRRVRRIAAVFSRRGRAVARASLVLVMVGVIAHLLTRARVTDATVGVGDAAQSITLPYSASLPEGALQDFVFHIKKTRFTQSSFVIVPDDEVVSISVGGEPVSLAGVDPKKLSDYRVGFRFPLGRSLKLGDNVVEVRVKNHGGPAGLDIHPDPRDWPTVLEACVVGAAILFAVGAALRTAGWAWAVIAVAVVAVVLRFAYWWVTPWDQRDHDAGGHVEYIEFILAHHALPKASGGYSFYHPALYYLVCAGQWAVLAAIGIERNAILRSLQLQSVVWEFGFSVFAVAAGRLWIDRIDEGSFGNGIFGRTGTMSLFAALVLLSPSAVMHSPRIGNDDLTYFFFGASLYFVSRWWFGADDRSLVLSAASAALGVLTKTNSVLLFPLIGVVFLARVRFREKQRSLIALVRRSWSVAALFVVSTTLALGRAALDTLAGRQGNLLVANAGRNTSKLIVGNHAENYLWLDMRAYVTQAFMSPWDDAKGRQYFWNYLLKTSLFGEWEFHHPWAWNLAVILSVLLLCLGAHAAMGMFLRKSEDRLGDLPLTCLFWLLIGSLALLRMSLPSACSGDFRYVLPVLLPCAWWCVRSISAYREQGWTGLSAGAAATAWLFVGVSVAFVSVVVAT